MKHRLLGSLLGALQASISNNQNDKAEHFIPIYRWLTGKFPQVFIFELICGGCLLGRKKGKRGVKGKRKEAELSQGQIPMAYMLCAWSEAKLC